MRFTQVRVSWWRCSCRVAPDHARALGHVCGRGLAEVTVDEFGGGHDHGRLGAGRETRHHEHEFGTGGVSEPDASQVPRLTRVTRSPLMNVPFVLPMSAISHPSAVLRNSRCSPLTYS